MANSMVERYVESAVQDMYGEQASRLMKVVNGMAARQGGGSMIENYKLLGKRALIVAGVALVAVQAVGSVVSYVVSRKSEEQRIERAVRRVLEEERRKAEEAETAAQ